MEHLIVTEISRHGYLAIFGLMVLESACIPIPSEAIMGFGGALTSGLVIAGVSSRLNFLSIVLVGIAGNLVGALIAYLVGRTGGRTAIEKWGKYILIRHRDLDKSEAFFLKRGDLAVLIGRILPVIRTFISLPAGIAEMPLPRFITYTVLGSIPWTLGLAYAGRLLAANWQTVSSDATPVSIIVALVILAWIIWWYIKRRRQLELKKS